MAVRICCDGCDCELAPGAATTAGRYDAVAYCPDCLGKFRAFEAQQRAKHAEIVRVFETWRAQAIADLKAKLAKLPDEG